MSHLTHVFVIVDCVGMDIDDENSRFKDSSPLREMEFVPFMGIGQLRITWN